MITFVDYLLHVTELFIIINEMFQVGALTWAISDNAI